MNLRLVGTRSRHSCDSGAISRFSSSYRPMSPPGRWRVLAGAASRSGHRFYAWDGPFDDLPDRDPIQMALELDPELKKSLDDTGAPPSWQRRAGQLNRGTRQLFVTDKTSYKRPIL